jgi:hypothetical protein
MFDSSAHASPFGVAVCPARGCLSVDNVARAAGWWQCTTETQDGRRRQGHDRGCQWMYPKPNTYAYYIPDLSMMTTGPYLPQLTTTERHRPPSSRCLPTVEHIRGRGRGRGDDRKRGEHHVRVVRVCPARASASAGGADEDEREP